MLRDFHQKSPLQFNEIFARSHNVFNNDEFENDLLLFVVGGGISGEAGGGGIFISFLKLGVHDKITLGEDRKSTLTMGGGGEG